MYEEIKDRLSSKDLASRMGYNVNAAGFMACSNERTPSLKLYESGFYCWRCDEGGDIFDLLMHIEGIEAIKNESVRKLSFYWLSALTISLLFRTFVPSTKEAAVIFMAPKILNSELVQEDLPEEAKELYVLAKRWVKDQVEDERDGDNNAD